MTGFRRTYVHCTECGAGLKLGDTPRWFSYPFIAAITVISVYPFLFLRDVIPFYAITLPLVALISAFPLGFLLAYFIRGVELNEKSNTDAT